MIIVAQDGTGPLLFKEVSWSLSISWNSRSKINGLSLQTTEITLMLHAPYFLSIKYSYFCHCALSYFFLKDTVSKNSRRFLVTILFSSTFLLIPFVFLYNLLVSPSGDVEVNSGPDSKPNEALSIYP